MFRKRDGQPHVVVVPHVAEPRTEYVTREVREVRAPTDESVRLLREMEDAARKNIENLIRISDNSFEAVVKIEDDNLSLSKIAVVLFSLNGVRMRAEVSKTRAELARSEGAMVEALCDAVASVIAKRILAEAFRRGMWTSQVPG